MSLRAGTFARRWLACAAMLAACGGGHGAFEATLASAERAQTAGRWQEAAQRYDQAATVATRPRDREHAQYLAARIRIANGQVAMGAAALGHIAKATPPGEHSAQAAFELARLHAEQGDPAGWTEMEAVALAFPANGVGRVALHAVLAHDDERGGPAAVLAHIDALSRGPLATTDLAQTLAYQAAACTERLGRLEAAREAYVALATRFPYPFGRLFDDALWHASEIDEKLGRPERAILDLERMLSVRESAHLMGSYERPRFPPAFLRIAALYRDRLGDRARARAAYRRAYDELGPSSPWRDDAAWEEASLFAADGDAAAACGRLRALVSAAPDSRYVPCAVARCPDITRPKDSRAPKECRSYLERRVRK